MARKKTVAKTDKNKVKKSGSVGAALAGATANLNEALRKLKANPSAIVAETGKSYSEITGWVPTGSISVDSMLAGGVPLGRVTEIFGANSEGKTSFLESLFYGNQLNGGVNFLILSDGSVDTQRMARRGIDLQSLVIVEVEYLEAGFDAIKSIADSIENDEFFKGKPIVIGWDSPSSVSGRNEISTGNHFASGMMSKPRQFNEYGRHVVPRLAKLNVALVMLTRLYQSPMMYAPLQTDCGDGQKYFASLRLYLKRFAWLGIKADDEGKTTDLHHQSANQNNIGLWSRATIYKSKIGVAPKITAEIPIISILGVDEDLSLFDFSTRVPLISDSGEIVEFNKNQVLLISSSGKPLKYSINGIDPPIQPFTMLSFRKKIDIPGVRKHLLEKCLLSMEDTIADRIRQHGIYKRKLEV